MSEQTQEQFQAIKETERELMHLSMQIAVVGERTAAWTWNLASTLVGRDLQSLTIGELLTLVREVDE